MDVGGRRATAAAPRAAGSRGTARASTSSRSASSPSSARRAPCRRSRSARSSRSRRNVAARTSVSRSCAWPTLPECMTTNRPSSPCARAHSLSRGCGVERVGVDPVRDHARAARAARPSPRAAAASSRRSRRPGRRGAGSRRRARAGGRRASGFSSRFSSTAISGKTSWLIDDERHAEAARDDERDVADHRRVGHAEDDVGPRRRERPRERAPR